MGDKLEDLMKDLSKKVKGNDAIEMDIQDLKEENNELNKEQEEIDKTQEKIAKAISKAKGKKVKVKIKQGDKLKEKEKQIEVEKKKIREQLRKLQKQAGKEGGAKVAGTKAKGTSQAKGTAGPNTQGVRCYIRYNNRGNPYRICDDGKKPPPEKPPSKITPVMDAGKFAEEHGGYSNLSKEQQKTYHRLYMAKQRAEERGFEIGGAEYRKLVNATKNKKKEVKKLKKLEQEQKVLQKRENRKKYKEEYAKLGAIDRKKEGGQDSKAVQKLKKKYGLTKKVQKTIEENKDEIKQAEANVVNFDDEIEKWKENFEEHLEEAGDFS